MIMFAEHARRLFEIVGKECTARGVFTLDQLPQAIQKLQQAVREEKLALQEAERKMREEGLDEENEPDNSEDPHPHPDPDPKSGRGGVHLGQRAYPLIHMMELTLKEEGYILWETDKDF
jgi:hypothetical protein